MSNFIAPPSIFTDGVDVSGTGFLAGEFPGGRTTANGVPASASVKAFYILESGDWQLAGQATSNPDGTWLICGINHDLRFNVVGQLDGYNDVVMANIKPMRTDMITYDDEYLQPNEDFKGMEGYILLLDGLRPFTVIGSTDVPLGMTTIIIDGRKLIFDGTTSEGGEWEAEITVQDANSNTVNIPVVIPIGLDAPSSLAATYDEAENQITLNWVSNSHVEQAFYIYRSDSPMDLDDLPPPIGSVGKGVTEFVDGDVVFEESYYYAVAAVYGSSVRVSGWLRTAANTGDPHWDKVVALLHFDGDFTDETGGVVTTDGALSFTLGKFSEAVRFTRSVTPRTIIRKSGLNIGSGDFTIEAWVRLSSVSLNNVIFDFRLGDGNSALPLVESDGGNLYVWVNSNYLIGPMTSALSSSQFKHIALVRSSGVLSLWLDGVPVGTAQYTHDMGIAQLTIGRSMNSGSNNVSFDLSGDIDELRITKGVARYTENFTPPTEPFPNF